MSTATGMEPVKAYITTPDGWRLEGWGTTSDEASRNLLRALNAWVQLQGQK